MEEKKRQGPQVVDFTFSADDPLTKEELALSYSKYYYVPFTPMNPLVSQILAAPVDPATCLTVQDAEKIFSKMNWDTAFVLMEPAMLQAMCLCPVSQ